MAKKSVITIIACCVSVVVFAQVDTSKNEKRVGSIIPIKMLDKAAVIDQRDIINWENGQKSTATGRQATGIGSGYSALKKGETVKIINPSASLTATKKTLQDNRKIKQWPDGQKATVTGNEATPINGGYSALGKRKR